ncbi:hypothetical protein LTR65_005250 [Meristemomyces frigidus]
MLSIAPHVSRARTPPISTVAIEPGAPKISRVRVTAPKTGNDSPPKSILKAVVDALAGNDTSNGDVFSGTSSKLPGSLLLPSSLARMINGYKSKEVDSGVKAWETSTYDPPAPARTSPSSFRPYEYTLCYINADLHKKPLVQFIKELDAAQQIYPARYSVFVGNLPAQFSNDILTRKVLAEFRQYGKVTGVVYRTKDRQGDKPWAILQYTTRADATNAVHQTRSFLNKGHKFSERAVRTDFCQAKRSIIVLTEFGRIESANAANPMEFAATGMSHGVKIVFETYGAYKAAKATLGGAQGGAFFVY